MSNKSTHSTVSNIMNELEKGLSEVRNIIAVLSGKGGVGKSIIASALAVGLSMKGYRVALFDADFHGPSIPWILGVENSYLGVTLEGKLIPIELNNLAIISIELLLNDKNAPIIWRGPLKARTILDLMTKTLWGKRDYLIVDLPPGTGDEALTIAQYLRIKPLSAILVLTPGSMVSHIVTKAKEFVKVLGVPLLGAVINMSYFECPVCGTKHYIFGNVDLKDVDILAEIPIDPALAQAVEKSQFVEFMKSDNKSAQILRMLSDIVEARTRDEAH